MKLLDRRIEKQEWMHTARTYRIIKVRCDFCGELFEVASDEEPNDDGLWKCRGCIEAEANIW
jgi:formylmethanofuran dehydrogenase subunit E